MYLRSTGRIMHFGLCLPLYSRKSWRKLNSEGEQRVPLNLFKRLRVIYVSTIDWENHAFRPVSAIIQSQELAQVEFRGRATCPLEPFQKVKGHICIYDRLGESCISACVCHYTVARAGAS